MKTSQDYFGDALPHVFISCTILGFDKEGLKVLVLKYKNSDLYALPSGSIHREEDIDFSAHRVLKETTSIQNHYLENFATFGKKNRANKDQIRSLLNNLNVPFDENHFMFQRFIALCYLALVDIKKVKLEKDQITDELMWVPVNEVPSLVHDYNQILKSALDYLRKNIYSTPVIQYLMPEFFTMKDLQQLYEIILQEKLVRTNFQRWMLKKNILLRTDKLYTGKAHKAPYLYCFKK